MPSYAGSRRFPRAQAPPVPASPERAPVLEPARHQLPRRSALCSAACQPVRAETSRSAAISSRLVVADRAEGMPTETRLSLATSLGLVPAATPGLRRAPWPCLSSPRIRKPGSSEGRNGSWAICGAREAVLTPDEVPCRTLAGFVVEDARPGPQPQWTAGGAARRRVTQTAAPVLEERTTHAIGSPRPHRPDPPQPPSLAHHLCRGGGDPPRRAPRRGAHQRRGPDPCGRVRAERARREGRAQHLGTSSGSR